MTNREIILKSVQFIEKNLKQEITVLDVAQEVCYSLYHFIRLFQSITGFSPKSYIQQRRLSEAVNDLIHSNKKIVDIAFEYQFGSHEAFTRAFRRQFNINPNEVRNGYPLTTFPLLYPLTEEFISRKEVVKNESPEIVELPEILLAGITVFVKDDGDGSMVTQSWGHFLNDYQQIKSRIMPERFYQVQYWSANRELGGLFFFIGVEVKGVENIPPQFVLKVIPRSRYLHFIHIGFSNKVGYTYKYIYNHYLPNTEYTLTQPFNFEFYGERYKGPYNEESESDIYIPVD